MRWLQRLVREIFGLFVDDGSLALLTPLWCAFALFVLPRAGLQPGITGGALFAGLAILLAASALRYKRPDR